MDWLSILVLVGGAAVCLMVPAFVACHAVSFTRRRLQEIRTTFHSGSSIKSYATLFTGTPVGVPSVQVAVAQFKSVHGWWQYAFAIGLYLLASAATASLALLPLFGRYLPVGTVLRVSAPMSMALAGALVWATYEAASKIQTRDIVPTDLYVMAIRMVTAVPVGYVASAIDDGGTTGATAFALMSLPMRDIRLFFRRRFLRKLETSVEESGARSTEGNLGQMVDGLGDETLARLAEHGIVTHLDMAYADPVLLMARSGNSLHLVLSWMDKALLAVYFGEKRTVLAAAGIPCALDACEHYLTHYVTGEDAAYVRDYATDPVVQDLAGKLGMLVAPLAETLQRVYEDPYVKMIRQLWYRHVYRPLVDRPPKPPGSPKDLSDALPEPPPPDPAPAPKEEE
jgi:hypothetical protein